MIIRTIKGTYSVLMTLSGSRDIRAYLCIREGEAADGKFLLMKPVRQELSKKMLVYFMELSGQRRIGDFVEAFAKDGVVWAVFRWHEGTPLSETAEHEERNARLLMKNELVLRLLAGELPPYLQYEAADARNLVVDTDGTVQINYLLFEPELMESADFTQVQKRLAGDLKQLFAREIKMGKPQSLVDLIGRMEAGNYADETGLLRELRRLDADFLQEEETGGFAAEGYLARVWKRLLRFGEASVRILYGLLVAGLLGLLVYVCIAPERAPADRMRFNGIGTLKIQGTESTGGIEGAEEIESTGGTESAEETESAKGTEGTKGTESTESTKNIEGAESAEGTEGTESTEVIEETESGGQAERG